MASWKNLQNKIIFLANILQDVDSTVASASCKIPAKKLLGAGSCKSTLMLQDLAS